MWQQLSHAPALGVLQPYFAELSPASAEDPARKSLQVPLPRGTFVKPLKQSFVTNPRLMPMTRVMLAMLAGWGGHGRPIETTLGIIAKHLSRSARQVQRYIKDAVEEGYLTHSYTSGQQNMITGLRLRLNNLAILHPLRKLRKRLLARGSPATTYESDNKQNSNTINWDRWMTNQGIWAREHSRQATDSYERLRAHGEALSRLNAKYKSPEQVGLHRLLSGGKGWLDPTTAS